MFLLTALFCCSCSDEYKPVAFNGSVTVYRRNEVLSVTVEFPGANNNNAIVIKTKSDLERIISYIENMQKDLKYVLAQLPTEENKKEDKLKP